MKKVGLTVQQVKEQCKCPEGYKPKDPTRVLVCLHRSTYTTTMVQTGKWHNCRTARSVARRLVGVATMFNKNLLRDVHAENCLCAGPLLPSPDCVALRKSLTL